MYNSFPNFSITPTTALFEHETTSIPSVFDNLEEAQSTDWLMNQPDRCPDLIAQDQRVLNCLLTMDARCTEALECCLQVLAESGADYQTYDSICYHLALAASKDISWAEAMKGPDAAKAIEALEAEMKSLNDTILTEIHPDDPEYNDAVRLATSGRFLLDIRRNLMHKARGVKQGFKENREQADGPNFNYYAHVAKFIQCSQFRPVTPL